MMTNVSYFALRARLRGFFHISNRTHYVHLVLQSCKWCDMDHSFSINEYGICTACLTARYGQ